jgi:hypothetical protein
MRRVLLVATAVCVTGSVGVGFSEERTARRDFAALPPNTWVKLSPLADTPPSPRLGYEGACVWDARHQKLVRYGGHNQGGGGEQGSEVWTFDPHTARWELMHPNTSPPGICCGQQNVFDPVQGRYVRFPAFSASHGWQWWREVYLNDASVWTYDLATNTWRNLRPLPTVSPRPLRCAAWDTEHEVIVMFGGEGSQEGTCVYDPWENSWTRMRPPVEPEFRSGGNMAYDARQRVHVLFGSQFSDDPHTWIYDLRGNVWRDARPPELPSTDRNDAVLTYDPAAGLVVAIVKITTGEDDEARHRLETWTYDSGANRWTKQDPQPEPDPTSNRARQLMYAPELNGGGGVALLENRPSRGPNEQQVWAYRLPARDADAGAGPALPKDVRLATRADAVELTWTASDSDAAASYAVYRGQGDRPWHVEYEKLATVAAADTRYVDRAPVPNKVLYYCLRAIDKDGREGPPGPKLRAQPRVVEDLVVWVTSPDRVQIEWRPPSLPGDTVAGYFVERAAVEVLTEDQLTRLKAQTPPLPEAGVGAVRRVGPFTQLTATPVRDLAFVDTTIDLRQPSVVTGESVFERKFHDEQLDADGHPYRFGVYAYRVRAVNALGVASGPSPAVLTIPSAPQFVFAREDGATCHLRWEPNPEHGLRGYRVYRMDGRYDKDPITRRTAEPVPATEYTDDAAGKPTRRYYVLAVDALGQEGHPSSPVWFHREWRDFYTPFVGEWHQ